MRRNTFSGTNKVRQSRFPVSLFAVFWATLLLMSGIHMGLIVWANKEQWSGLTQTVIPMVYWAFVAAGLTLYTRWQVKRNYEEPMQEFAKATAKVAQGDFSVYVAPLHTPDKQDYLDVQRREYAKIILHATRRLSNLIMNMLKLNKLEKQTIKPAPKQFDLCAQLSECALQFEHRWEQKNIEFIAQLEDRAFVTGDEELLALVWTTRG